MRIGNHKISRYLSPYIIAEAGVNHGGSLESAKRLIDEAAEGGAHAVKFQTYKAGKLASKDSPAYWDLSKEPTKSQFELFGKYDAFGPAEYEILADHCNRRNVDFLSTPFDLDAVDFLLPLAPAFKIASADITNVPLLRKAARTGRPVMLSTGASTLPEIEFAVSQLRSCGCGELALMHCVLNYPTRPCNAQLGQINVLKRVFPDVVIGYSDHVAPDEAMSSLEAAALLGAAIIEKHFTFDKSLPGNDHYHAMDRHDLSKFVEKIKKYKTLMGEAEKDISLESDARVHARRSIVAGKRIEPGELFTEGNLTVKRPGSGISPLFWDEVIGRAAASAIEEDQLLEWKQII